jgi:hypothetical protein
MTRRKRPDPMFLFLSGIQNHAAFTALEEGKHSDLYHNYRMRCEVCAHKWIAVAKVGLASLKCPECTHSNPVQQR